MHTGGTDKALYLFSCQLLAILLRNDREKLVDKEVASCFLH